MSGQPTHHILYELYTFDGPARNALLPFTFTRPVADILIGIMTIRQNGRCILDLPQH
jgi:hypothetical protein